MKYLYILVVFAVLVLSACNTNTPDTNPNPTNPTNPNNPAPNPASLTASVVKNYTVAVSWGAQSGTATLERKVADGEFESLGEVTGKTAFEDFPVFDDITYTYRLKAGSQSSEVTVNVPAVTPNPLTVTLTADTAQSVKQMIGTSGGSISATGANGVVYTLTIPPDALLNDTEITLTPISQIGNLPLSGGLLGAVKIEPEDLEFYNYTTLTMTSTPATPTDTKAVAFTSSTTGQEFCLYPFAERNLPSSVLQAQQDDDDLAPIKPIKGGTYGAGSGTAQDVKKQVQDNPPTDQVKQSEQQIVVDDDLAPLPRNSTARGQSDRLRVKELNSPSSQTRQLFREYRQWLALLRLIQAEKEFDADIKAHSKRQADRIRIRFDELYQQCEDGDRSVRKEMKELLHWSKLYPAIVQNLGAQWFSEAQDRVETCGIPNWEGAASAQQPQAILNGYSGSAEITYVVAEVDDDLVTYEARATNLRFDINSGNGCTATVTTIEANRDPEQSFLTVDYSTKPATYSAGFFLNVSYTIACPNTPAETYTNVPFPILFGFDGEALLSNNDQTLTGVYDIPETTYSSTWTLNAVPRSNP